MHVIWALGQEPGEYVHIPKSGLEKGTPSIPDFYRPDELKYHGKKNRDGFISQAALIWAWTRAKIDIYRN